MFIRRLVGGMVRGVGLELLLLLFLLFRVAPRVVVRRVSKLAMLLLVFRRLRSLVLFPLRVLGIPRRVTIRLVLLGRLMCRLPWLVLLLALVPRRALTFPRRGRLRHDRVLPFWGVVGLLGFVAFVGWGGYFEPRYFSRSF